MKTRLIAFGDSWTWGDELRNPAIKDLQWVSEERNTAYRLSHGFPGLVARHYGLDLENHGSNGQSLQSMIWTFEWWLDHTDRIDDCMILFGLTSADRISWWWPERQLQSNDPPWYQYLHSTWLESANGPDYKRLHDMHKIWRSYCVDDQWRRRNYQSAVYLFSGTCDRLGIPCVLFNIFSGMPQISHSPVINASTGLIDQLRDTYPGRQDEHGRWGDSHPNEAGHQIIADLLISHIDSCKLLGC